MLSDEDYKEICILCDEEITEDVDIMEYSDGHAHVDCYADLCDWTYDRLSEK